MTNHLQHASRTAGSTKPAAGTYMSRRDFSEQMFGTSPEISWFRDGWERLVKLAIQHGDNNYTFHGHGITIRLRHTSGSQAAWTIDPLCKEAFLQFCTTPSQDASQNPGYLNFVRAYYTLQDMVKATEAGGKCKHPMNQLFMTGESAILQLLPAKFAQRLENARTVAEQMGVDAARSDPLFAAMNEAYAASAALRQKPTRNKSTHNRANLPGAEKVFTR